MRPILGDTAGAVISVPEPEAGEISVNLYPNPTRDLLHVELTGNGAEEHPRFRAEVYSTNGQRILHTETDRTIDLSGVANGLYLVRITNIQGTKVLKQARIVVNNHW